MSETERPLLEVRDLRTVFFDGDRFIRAADGVEFDVRKGEIFGILGESGSGKTVTTLSLIGLPGGRPGIIGGSVKLEGRELLGDLSRYCKVSGDHDDDLEIVIDDLAWARRLNKVMKPVRGKQIGMIFQEPSTSLDPYFRIKHQLAEALRRNAGLKDRAAVRAESARLLKLVGLDPDAVLDAYPGRLSGGQCQRVMIALVMASRPKLLIADEPTTYLDPITQLRILDLLEQLVEKERISIILITHDMDIMARYAHRLLVMYAGQVLERGSREAILESEADCSHPYTRLLRGMGDRAAGVVGSNERAAGRSGCVFYPQCDVVEPRCERAERPPLVQVGPEHWVRCWRCT
jgi:peptide/nickel transport system ATP-binding protein